MLFWKSWNWLSYSRECLLYWLCWYLVVEMSWLTVKKPKSTYRYFRLWMWRHVGTQNWGYSSVATDHANSHSSGSTIQNTAITSQFSQHNINVPLWSMPWQCWGHCDIVPCGCQRGILSHCITWLQCTITYSILWMAWCELWPRRRLNGRKTCSLLWS